MKKLKIVAGVVIVGGAIAGIAGSQIKHRDCQDSVGVLPLPNLDSPTWRTW